MRRNSFRSYRHLFAQPHIKYEFIEEQRQHYSVQLLCEALEVSESGYYAWKHHEPSAHEREDARIAALIQPIFQEHRHLYGSPRIHAKLRDYGVHCVRKRVVRLMQLLGLTALAKRSRKPTTKSDKCARFAPHLLHREFSADQPNTRWVTDTRAVETAEGWLYLAVILDLFSRQVVGWAMAATEDGELTELVLRMAVARRHPEAGLLHHSDRGTEFTGERYQAALRELGVEVSRSRTGNCWENAAMEAFFATLAKECINRAAYQTRQEARSSIFEYRECLYNPIRLHSTLQYMSPVTYEQAHVPENERVVHKP